MVEPTLRILSLGAGVQSTTLLLMACEGKFVPGLDAAIFADTGWEPASVYDHLDLITQHAAEAGIMVYRVSKGNLRDDLITPGQRYASIPYYIQNEPGPCKPCQGKRGNKNCSRCHGTGWDDGKGMGRRQCTPEYKTALINRHARQLLGAKPPDFRHVPKGRVVEQWIGFSADEIGRVSDANPVQYARRRYPLIELGMDRKACERWLRSRGWTSVAKSACIGCPYHGNRMWRDMRDNRPDEWADAVAFDEAIRKGGVRGEALRGEAFLHRSRVPLAIAPIDRVTRAEWRDRQGDLLDLIADMEEGDPDGCSPYGCRSGSPA
jgi:hypothetical protein